MVWAKISGMIRKLISAFAALILTSALAWAASVYLNAATTPAGLDVNISSGAAANATANGPSINLTTSDGGATSGNAGALIATTGNAVSGDGGNNIFTSGNGGGAGTGGTHTYTAGDGGATGDGGAFIYNAGTGGATSGNGGRLDYAAGNANGGGTGGRVAWTAGGSVGARDGGPVVITSGNTTGMSNVAGEIQLTTGVNGNSARGSIKTKGALADTNYDYQTPSTGFSITLSEGVWHTIINPAGTLLAGTVTMPAAPVDGQIVNVRSSQIITGLTVSPNSGQSILGAPTTLALGGIFECIYKSSNTTWFC